MDVEQSRLRERTSEAKIEARGSEDARIGGRMIESEFADREASSRFESASKASAALVRIPVRV